MVTISASSLSTFLSCHRKHFYKFIERREEEKSDPVLDGIAAHDSIAETDNKQDLILKLIETGRFSDTQARFLAEEAYSYISDYDFIEKEKKVEVEIENAKLKGFIDVIAHMKNGSVNIIDWKFSRNKPAHKNYLLQAAFYYLLLSLLGTSVNVVIFANIKIGGKVVFTNKVMEAVGKELLDNIIPFYIREYESKARTGIFNNICRFCYFREECLGNEYKISRSITNLRGQI